jgi:hypothetical protein
MKRTIIIAIFLCSLVLLQGQAWAQVKPNPTGKPAEAQSKATLQWELADGIQVMRLWKVEGASVWPQIAILRMSNDNYLKFFQDPKGFMKFVNDQKIFSKDVIEVGPWVSLSSVDPKDHSPDWAITVLHRPQSRIFVSALPLM